VHFPHVSLRRCDLHTALTLPSHCAFDAWLQPFLLILLLTSFVNANAVRRSQLHPQVAMGVQVGVRVFAQVYQEVAHSAKKGGGQGAKDAMNQGASAVRTKLSQQMALEVRVCGQTQRLHPPLI
jgi:hypothetical protein